MTRFEKNEHLIKLNLKLIISTECFIVTFYCIRIKMAFSEQYISVLYSGKLLV